ncbi:MAG: ATP synthase F1 subunit gamma [Bacteroidia bacterium]|nr:ATP synthase F1 subunit gamma [Bacteroidia bacterium]
MANLKEIRARIKAVKGTQQVTKAMKMVAAAKLRRAQDQMLQLRPYASKLREIIGNVVSVLDAEEIPSRLVEAREVRNVLVVVVTSNRGLAGPFNTNIIRQVHQFAAEHHKALLDSGRVQFICIGRKGFEYFRKRGFPVNDRNYDVFAGLSFGKVNEVTDLIFRKFLSGEVDKVYLAYNEFKNVMTQIRRVDAFLPLAVDSIQGGSAQSSARKSDYIFEPGREEILTDLIPKALRIQVYRAVLESNASEQGARMVAMDAATENAEELLKQLRLNYNKARQASITKEILEIAAGANALAAQ